MRCPHCGIGFHENTKSYYFGGDVDGKWLVRRDTCSECHRYMFWLIRGEYPKEELGGNIIGFANEALNWLVYPKTTGRPPCHREVPPELARDYNEACMILVDSARASAAMSRRCLQHLLRHPDGAVVKPADLDKEIQQVLDSKALPTRLAQAIDAVRVVGNFAAHPIKSKSTGEVVDVEPGEAEWNLDTLEGLFDFYFVQPAILSAKKDALNKKLRDAGKPPLK